MIQRTQAIALVLSLLLAAGGLARPGVAAAQAPAADADEVWSPMYRAQCLFDQTTLLKRWRVAELPGVPRDRITAIAPAVRKKNELTGEHKPPVRAVRASPAGPRFDLDFGELPVGCYVVRIIAMVRTEDIEQYRKPLMLELTVNDKPASGGSSGGEPSRYRQRIPYWDDFYCVTEIYFNADEARAYRGQLTVGEGSLVDLYINRIELHDVLAGLSGEAYKARPGFFTEAERQRLRSTAAPDAVRELVSREVAMDPYLRHQTPELSPQERQARDERLWHAVPPMNSQFIAEYDERFAAEASRPGVMSDAEAAEKYGLWEHGSHMRYAWFTPLELVNKKLGLHYTREDLIANRPLPDPYPFTDDGLGVYFPKQPGMEHGEHFLPIAIRMGEHWASCRSPVAPWHGGNVRHRLAYLYHALDDRRAARDAALLLARWAYLYPTHTDAQTLGYAIIAPATMYNRDMRLSGRSLMFYTVSDRGAHLLGGLCYTYDYLFDFIKGNDELAQAVGRFIPWVKTDADVRRLIETRVLQFGARQCMTFNLQSDKGSPTYLFRAAVVQQDPQVTRPWLDFLWSRTWIYPYPTAGLPDYLSTTTQRDGTTDIGSVFYTAEGQPLAELALLSRRYVQNGGDPKFDLTDPALYGKARGAGSFLVDQTIAGGFPMSIGDVGGPDRPRLLDTSFPGLEQQYRNGYELGGDPALAWMIVHYFGRGDAADATWRRIQSDAAAYAGHPFLKARPRVMANWAGIVEHGYGAPDFRFLTAAMLRVGTGHGHSHRDTLDLQLVALGARMLNDVGWRGGYSVPKSTMSQLHNLVEVDEHDWEGHAWIDAFSPDRGAPPGQAVSYMRAVATPPASLAQVTQRYRGVALIDVDRGDAGALAPHPMPYTNDTRFDPEAMMPKSYVFDVERVRGGKLHTWCFHGTISDQFEVNMPSSGTTLTEAEAQYLRRFLSGDALKYAGDAPPTVIATWRLRRTEEVIEATTRDEKVVRLKQTGGEPLMLGGTFDPAAPARFIRVHLAVHDAPRLLVGHIEPREVVEQTWPFLFAQRRSDKPLDSVFASVIEPFAGEPFIRSVRALDVAAPAAAVEVMLEDGRRDVCYSSDDAKPRNIGELRIAGRFAFVREDDRGLVQAKLVEGATLATPHGTLTLEQPNWTARVERVDYATRRVWLGDPWPGAEVAGEQVEFGNDEHRTSFTISDAARENGQLVLTLDKAMDLSYAHVTAVDVATKTVKVNVVPTAVNHRGMNAGLTCTNEDMTRRWTCSVVKGGYKLQGEFSEHDLPVGSVLRLWELGVGDEAKLVAHAAVRRGDDGGYQVVSNGNASWK